MTTLPQNDLYARLEQLETSQRRMRRAMMTTAVGAVAVVGAALLGGFGPSSAPTIIEADAFIVRDANGHARATLSCDEAGGPALTLTDRIGRTRLVLSTTNDNALIGLLDSHGKTRLRLGSDASGAEIVLNDGTENSRLLLRERDRGVFMAFGDRAQAARIGIGVTPEDGPHMTILDRNERTIWSAPR